MPEKSTPFWAPVYAIIGRKVATQISKVATYISWCFYILTSAKKKKFKKFQKIKKEIENVEVLYEIVDFFVLDMCFKPWGLYFAQKLLRKAKPQVARTAKICSKRQKLLKSCQAQSGKAYPGLIHYVLLICENVSLDWSTMQLVGNYGFQ